ncbi:DUF2939 domain-containing protein [Sandaracinobacteroides hominis]|uniref:DUF2939 domain-containing protein n=1 Tax=Sandaracinobacteroides hominis TaxID=2780086 RepID=UPI0018F5F861|nr:DUF2939 domain-containing protein [Sandaracinobacteroides hominis]
MTLTRRMLRHALLLVAAIVAIFIVAFGCWYATSPRYTLTQMQAAAVDGNAGAFAAHVDFPSLRASLKSELRARLYTQAGDAPASSLKVLGIGMALGFVDQMVDSAVSPESVGVALASVGAAGNWVGPIGLQSLSVLGIPEHRITRLGFDHFEVTRPDGSGPALVFARDGLSWRLAAMRLNEPKPDYPAA